MISVDVIKIADRLSKEGRTVTFQVHHDNAAAIAVLALGSQWRMTLVPLDDDGNPEGGDADNGRSQTSADKMLPASVPEQPARARQPFTSLPLVKQAALLCKDLVFLAFLREEYRYSCATEEEAADFIRHFCNVTSRSNIAPDGPSGLMFRNLREQYLAWKLVAA